MNHLKNLWLKFCDWFTTKFYAEDPVETWSIGDDFELSMQAYRDHMEAHRSLLAARQPRKKRSTKKSTKKKKTAKRK